MKRSILISFILFLCSESFASDARTYVGIDGKLVKSNSKANGTQYRHNKHGLRPSLGFKVTDDFALELSHEWSPSGIFRKTKEGVNVSSSATSALLSATLEKESMLFPDSKWFISGGLAHTKIRIFESGPQKRVLGRGKVTKTVPAAAFGLKTDLGEGLSVRGFLDWKGTRGMKIERLQHPRALHNFKHTFGLGVGLTQEF